MSASATLRPSGVQSTGPSNASMTGSRSAKQRCRDCLKRCKVSVTKRLHSSKRSEMKAMQDTDLDNSPDKTPSRAFLEAIASDPATVPNFSELDGKLGELEDGWLDVVVDELKSVASCMCCLLCGSVGCVCGAIAAIINCLCCPVAVCGGVIVALATDGQGKRQPSDL